MKKLVSILILAFCVFGMSAQNVVMKVKVNGNQVAETEDGTRISLSGVLTLPKDAFSEISFFEKSMQVEASTPEVNRTNVTIPLKFEGDPLSDITQWGIRYALSEDKLENDYTEDAKNGSPDSKETSYSLSGLMANTTYFGKAFAKFNGEEIFSNIVSFTTGAADNVNFPIPDEPIDLGLPSGTKWSPWNLGASKANEVGEYCGWGDKTASIKEVGTIYYADGKVLSTINGTEYDAATYQWEDKWRMPTKADFKELYQYCTTSIDTENNILIFKSTINQKTISFPLAGYMSALTGHPIDGVGSMSLSLYWLAETNPSSPSYPLCIRMSYTYNDDNSISKPRYNLYQIRPVYGPVVDEGDYPPSVDPTDKDAWKKYTTTTDNNGNSMAVPLDGVDMGLPSGTKWAAWNVGALPHDKKGNIDYGIIGRYYAWGEIDESNEYTEEEYELSPYHDASPNFLESKDDVATKWWGEDWQMPSVADFEELFKKDTDGTTYEYVTVQWVEIKKGDENKGINPVYGYKVTSKKTQNTIYLQAAGYKRSNLLINSYHGYYWSCEGSSLSGKRYTHSEYMDFSEAYKMQTFSTERFHGLQVRPVKYKK